MTNDHAITPVLDRLADVTGRYARYSRSAGGLSSVIGGILCLGVFVTAIFAPLGAGLRATLASAPLLWLAAKEALRRFYYQRSGLVAERLTEKQRRWHRWMTIYLSAVAALIVGGLLARVGREALAGPILGYLTIVAAMPLVAWRWFWSITDFLIGVLLMCQAAVLLAGRHYPVPFLFIAVSFSAIAIAGGMREHRDYLTLRRQLGPA